MGRGCWIELFWSCRAAWTGIIAVWAVLLVLNLIMVSRAGQPSALQPLSREEIAWLQAQQLRFRMELATSPTPGDRKKESAVAPGTGSVFPTTRTPNSNI